MHRLFAGLALVFLVGCYSHERNCKRFKTGVFKSEIVIDGKTYASTFKRTETLQIENYNGHIDSSKIRWINDCEVVFKTINPKNSAEKKDVHLKILQTKQNSYTFEYSYIGDTKKQKGIAYKTE